jgi:uncharacterized SAM-binding protein YcdF (DUF218 family)
LKRNWFYFIGSLIFISTLYLAILSRVGVFLVRDDVPGHADAIVILMGNFPERVLQAADLFADGRADRLIIVEESMGAYRGLEERGVSIISKTTQARDAAIGLGIPADSITILPGDARSTLTEAVIVSKYISDNRGTDTLILVSSSYHMRRAEMIFRKALKDAPGPIFVGCSPSAYTRFNADRWWREKEDIQHVLTEYLKIMSFRLIEKRNLK